MNKLGCHIHGIKPGIIEAVTLLQPRTVTIMDPKPEDLRAIHDASPETFIAMRKYENGRRWQDTDPFDWAEQCYDMSQGLANGVIGWNEPFGHDDRGSCAPFDEWTYAFWLACRQIGSMEAVVLCMATGNWTGADDRYKITNDFPLTCGSARFFGPHEYSWPNLQAGAGWYALRFKAWIEDLKAIGREDFSFIISEAGLTQAVIAGRDDIGWRSGGPEDVTEDSYIFTLSWYNARLCEVLECLGCCLYDYAGQWYDWGTFEQLGLEQRIYQIQAPEPPEPPEPNGGEPMEEIKIYDFDHGPGDDEVRDWDWLRSVFGDVQVHPIEDKVTVNLGDVVYKIVWLSAKRGNTSLVINVQDVDGQPVEHETVMWGWPDAPPHGYAGKPSNWSEFAIPQDTNAEGDAGPGMGTGSYYDPATERGGHEVWVWDLPSDFVDGLGMIAGTFHDHVEIGYRAVIWGEEPPPPPPPPDGTLEKILAVAKATKADTTEILRILGTTPPPPEPEVFHVEFFNNEDLAGEPVHTMTEAPPFWHDWGNGSPVPGVVNEDHISGRWSAYFTFAAGVHTFNVKTDDGARLWVDGELILDKWYAQGPTPYKVDVALTAGLHEVVLEWFERAGGATLHFNWER